MEEINLEKYNLTFEIQYVQYMVELLKPYVEFEQFNTTESTVDIAGEPVLKKGLKMFLKKENGIQESIGVNQFIQFIQVDFPNIIQEKFNFLSNELTKNEKEIVKLYYGGSGGRGGGCPEGMDKNEYNEKRKYNSKTKKELSYKEHNLERIKKYSWDRIKTIDEVLRFLTNVKDHYIK